MVSVEAVMPTLCVIDGQEERDAAVVSIPNACAQMVVIDDFKAYPSSEFERCKAL